MHATGAIRLLEGRGDTVAHLRPESLRRTAERGGLAEDNAVVEDSARLVGAVVRRGLRRHGGCRRGGTRSRRLRRFWRRGAGGEAAEKRDDNDAEAEQPWTA